MLIGICDGMKVDNAWCQIYVKVSVTDFYRSDEGSEKYVEVDCTVHSDMIDTSLLNSFFSIRVMHYKDRWGFNFRRDDIDYMVNSPIYSKLPLIVRERIFSIIDNCMTPDGRDKDPFVKVERDIDHSGIVFSVSE